MGLDAVEIVLRAEELYSVSVTDEEVGVMRTVGDFYKLICARLSVEPLSAPVRAEELPIITKREKSFWPFGKHISLPAPPHVLPWNSQSVWDCLVAIFVDQMALEPDEVMHNATISKDFRVS